MRTFNNSLQELIPTVQTYRRELESLNVQLAKTTLTGKISSLSVAETLFLYMEETQQRFAELQEQLVNNLAEANISKVSKEINFKAQVTIDILIRNLFERTADVGFLATDDDIRRFLQKDENVSKSFIESRLVEYVQKYSVYDDIIILDPQGKVVANLDKNNKLTHSRDPLVLETINSDEEYIENFRETDLQKHKRTALTYSAKITQTNDKNSKVLGVLCLCFGFRVEMKETFSELLAEDNTNETLILTDKNGHVIASSNKNLIYEDDMIKGDLEKEFILKKYKGNNYIISTSVTKGYQDYFGSGWQGLVMVPVSSAFKHNPKNSIEIPQELIENSNMIPEKLKIVMEQSEEINEDLIDVVINGEIIASKQRAYALNPILENIRSISGRIHDSISQSIIDIRNTIIASLVNDVKALSALAVDIMDRNLYERANDARWWALTTDFRKVLEKKEITEEDSKKVGEILAYINELYTVYTNLFVYDKSQKIIAVSNIEESEFIGKNISGRYISTTLGNNDSQKYFVSEFKETPLYNNKETYIYSASITSLEEENKTLGGIGIVFDSTPEFKEILTEILPKKQENKDSFALFLDESFQIISSTDDKYKTGELFPLNNKFTHIKQGESIASIEKIEEKYFIIGITKSSGYREFKVNDNYENSVFGVVLIEV